MRLVRLITTIAIATSALFTVPLVAQLVPSAIPSWNPRILLLYVGESSDPQCKLFQDICRSSELAEMRVIFRPQPRNDYYDTFVREYGLARSSTWALAVVEPGITVSYRCLLQGTELPLVSDIQNALDRGGIKSVTRLLRDFLKTHPDNIDVRAQLLQVLREVAENATQHSMGLKTETALSEQQQARDFYSGTALFDTTSFKDKMLESEQDASIWGPYAQVLDAIFNSGDWQMLHPGWVLNHTPLEICSPTMIQIYTRHLPKIEAYLVENPHDARYWLLYGWMVSITKHSSVRSLFDRILPTPWNDLNSSWPNPEVLSLLVAEERARENWGYIAEMLMSNWPVRRQVILNYTAFSPSEESAKATSNRLLDSAWQNHVKPLIESLIKSNRAPDAETVILDMAKNSTYGNIQRLAAGLALNLGRQDLQYKWLALETPEKNKVDMDAFLARLFPTPPAPRIVVTNLEESANQQINKILRDSRLAVWGLSPVRLNQNTELPVFVRQLLPDTPVQIGGTKPNQKMPELVRRFARWPVDETFWGLFYDNTMLADGSGLPTVEKLVTELELARVQTFANALRHHISQYPSNFTAKERLLRELKRIAELKVKEKFGEAAGVDFTLMLTEEEDRDIWGEFALLYVQTFPFFMEHGRPVADLYEFENNGWTSNYFMHSEIMKDLAREFLPRAKACIERRPTAKFLWYAWAALSDLNGKMQFKDLRESLAPLPLHNHTDIPGVDVMRGLVQRCWIRSDWQGIIDVVEWYWEIMQERGQFHQHGWQVYLSPLLEAYLHLDKSREANELISVWSYTPAWPHIKQSAVDLAKKCGKENLGERWERL
ncbi:MAG: hypothetical protein FWG02_03275 [Holophagaceae bacterium]|nr:hypothetical protein [Holophagaceae bacterium]